MYVSVCVVKLFCGIFCELLLSFLGLSLELHVHVLWDILMVLFQSAKFTPTNADSLCICYAFTPPNYVVLQCYCDNIAFTSI